MENRVRCAWCEKDDLYRDYHDNEWGNPVYDDETIFEFLVLETFQAGLSWYTILKKREKWILKIIRCLIASTRITARKLRIFRWNLPSTSR